MPSWCYAGDACLFQMIIPFQRHGVMVAMVAMGGMVQNTWRGVACWTSVCCSLRLVCWTCVLLVAATVPCRCVCTRTNTHVCMRMGLTHVCIRRLAHDLYVVLRMIYMIYIAGGVQQKCLLSTSYHIPTRSTHRLHATTTPRHHGTTCHIHHDTTDTRNGTPLRVLPLPTPPNVCHIPSRYIPSPMFVCHSLRCTRLELHQILAPKEASTCSDCVQNQEDRIPFQHYFPFIINKIYQMQHAFGRAEK